MVTNREYDANPAGATDDLVPRPDVADGNRPDPAARDSEAAVHLGLLDRHPMTTEADDGFEVGRRVEVVREDTVSRGRAQHGLAGVDLVHTVGLQAHEDAREPVVAVGADDDDRVGLVLVGLAEVDRLDGVVTAVVQDVVENSGQDPGVHQVAGDLHALADLHGATVVRPARRRPSRSRRAAHP